MNIEDLEYFCTLYQSTQRDADSLATLKQIIEMDPVFDKKRRYLFQLVYKSIIDAMRDQLRTLQQYLEVEQSTGRVEICKEITERKDSIISKLIPRCKEGIETMDTTLIPNAESPDAQIFFIKFKADLFRYISEFSDETEALSALKQAEDLYSEALTIASENLPKCHPTFLGVVLNASVFQYEHKKNMGLAVEMCQNALLSLNESFQQLDPESQEETNNLIKIMKRNLASWASEEEEEENE